MMGNFSFYISSGSPGFAEQEKMEFHMEEAGTSKKNLFLRNKTSGCGQEGEKEVEESICSSLPLEVANQEIKKISDHQNGFLEKEILQCYKKSLEGNMLSEDTDVIILDMIEIEKEIEDPVEEFLKSVTPQTDATLHVENQVERRKEASKALLELASSLTEFDKSNTLECVVQEKHKILFENVSVLKNNISKNSKIGNLICEGSDSEVTLSGDEICEYKDLSDDDKLFNTHSPYDGNVSCFTSDHDHNYCLPYSAWMKVASNVQRNDGTENNEVVDSIPYRLKQIIIDHEYSKTQYTYPPTLKPSSLTKVISKLKTEQKPHLRIALSKKKKTHQLNRKKIAAATKKKHEGAIAQYKANIGGKSRKTCAKVCKKYGKSKPAQIACNKKSFAKYKSKEFISSSPEITTTTSSDSIFITTSDSRNAEKKIGEKRDGRDRTEKEYGKSKPAQIACNKKSFTKYKSKEFISSSSETTTTTSSDSIFSSTSDSSSDSSNDEDKPLKEIKSKLTELRNKVKGKKYNFFRNRNKLSSGNPISLQIAQSSKPQSVYKSLNKNRNFPKKKYVNSPKEKCADSHTKKCVNCLSNPSNHEAHLKKLVVVLEDCMKSDYMTNFLCNKHTVCSKNKSSSLQKSSHSNLSSNSHNYVSKKRKPTKKKCANSSDTTNHEIYSKKLIVVLEDCMKSIKFRTKLSPTRDLVPNKNSSDLESEYITKQNEQLTSLTNIENEIDNLCPNSKPNYFAKSDTFVSENSEKGISQICGSESINPGSMFSNAHSSLNVIENAGVFSNAKECTNQIHHDNENESEMADDLAIPELISDIKIESLYPDESFHSDSDVELLCVKEPTTEVITLEEADEVVQRTDIS